MSRKVLITGASGFIGSFLVEGGLERGMEVWAGVRKNSRLQYLKDSRIHFIELDFTRPGKLAEQLSMHKQLHGKWDCIIHCAGVTKCLHKEEFEIGNYICTRNFVEALRMLDMVPGQFIFISSLSIFGPVHERDHHHPIRENDTAMPDTAYGASKLKSEHYLQSMPDFPALILRPTGVYGPRERDYLLLVKSIRRHVDFAAGFKRQDITFVYVKDLVQAVYLAVRYGVRHRAYLVSDGNVYSSRTFSDLVRKELGNPWIIRIRCPLFLLKALSLLAGLMAGCFGKVGTLNGDKYKIMKQRNWKCDISPLMEELGYRPEYTLEKGVRETVAWYREEGWL